MKVKYTIYYIWKVHVKNYKLVKLQKTLTKTKAEDELLLAA